MKTIIIHPKTCNPYILIVTDNVSPTSSIGGHRSTAGLGQTFWKSIFSFTHTYQRAKMKKDQPWYHRLKGSWEQSASTTSVENGSVFATKSQDPNALHFVMYSCVHTQEIPGSKTVHHKPECGKASLVSSWRSWKTTHTPLIYPDGKISIRNKNEQWRLLRHGWIW